MRIIPEKQYLCTRKVRTWNHFSKPINRECLKGVINNLFNEEYQSVLSRPMPRLNYEIFLDIRPKWGKRNKKQ